MPRVPALRLAALCATLACVSKPEPVRVGVVFGNDWTLGRVTLSDAEQSIVRRAALGALREAYSGFAVDFDEDEHRERIVRLERHLLRLGATPIGSKVSAVSLDGVHLTLLHVTGCSDVASCAAYPRTALVEALGRGIGATAAHELGHQAGFGFVHDSRCDACYDGASARSQAHFFAEKHWSDGALAIMNRALSPR